MYLAHSKRVAVDRATGVRDAMISGMWSNSNLDDGKDTRSKALMEIEESYQNTLISIYNEDHQEEQIDLDRHPLFTEMNIDD